MDPIRGAQKHPDPGPQHWSQVIYLGIEDNIL